MACTFLWKEKPFMPLAEKLHLDSDMAAFQERRFPRLRHPTRCCQQCATRSKDRTIVSISTQFPIDDPTAESLFG